MTASTHLPKEIANGHAWRGSLFPMNQLPKHCSGCWTVPTRYYVTCNPEAVNAVYRRCDDCFNAPVKGDRNELVHARYFLPYAER